MKKLTLKNPSVPYYASFFENDAPNPGFLFNNDAIPSNPPYKQDEIPSPSNQEDKVKVCYEIGNSSEIEDSYDIVIEDSIMAYSDNDLEDEPLM